MESQETLVQRHPRGQRRKNYLAMMQGFGNQCFSAKTRHTESSNAMQQVAFPVQKLHFRHKHIFQFAKVHP